MRRPTGMWRMFALLLAFVAAVAVMGAAAEGLADQGPPDSLAVLEFADQSTTPELLDLTAQSLERGGVGSCSTSAAQAIDYTVTEATEKQADMEPGLVHALHPDLDSTAWMGTPIRAVRSPG